MIVDVLDIAYDATAKALYLRLSDHEVEDSLVLSDSVYVDMDAQGELIGIEVLHAKAPGDWAKEIGLRPIPCTEVQG